MPVGTDHGVRRVVCLGDLMVDVLARLPGPLAIGSDTPAPIAILGGGSAANTAAWLVSAGTPARFVGCIGDDALGRAALDALATAGVDVDVHVDAALPTGTCLVLVDPSGERTMVPSAGANTVPAAVPDFEATDWLHVSGYALFHEGNRVGETIAAARSAGCGVSVDAASSAPLREYGPRRFLADVSPALLFANRDEARVLTGLDDIAGAARQLGQRCGEAIVKDGAAGSVWSDGAQVITAGCNRVAVLDSTGAGDAFAAGVLAARARGGDVAEALRAGNGLAARAIIAVGGRPISNR